MNEDQFASTRERILEAAVAVARSGEKVTVRGVAARAGVGMGTLRYHFGTQRELQDAVLSSLYEAALPDERIRDASVPPGERLLECLGHLLTPLGIDRTAREAWTDIFRTFIDLEAPDATRDRYVELHRQTMRRIESWLSILVEEGSLARGDNSARATFLLTVVNGLAVQRALPAESAPLETEKTVLQCTIGALPFTR
ncbi:TetR/AcrR family transcriptional regulator [Microbacterium timonense]|uniref:TetR/AcrR family transcriptional regulator n=1 Tax=Microbacterium timonense TaxID=2086576 RepID=UPI000D109850|nr:TetR/AcrR family transcriptional regulator [Microbacterium timonense]